jgi:hypothetical protein
VEISIRFGNKRAVKLVANGEVVRCLVLNFNKAKAPQGLIFCLFNLF